MIKRFWLLLIVLLSLVFIPNFTQAADWVSAGFSDSNISSLFVNPKNNQKMVVSITPKKDSYNYYTEDGGNTWTPTGPTGTTCSNITSNPKNPAEIWMGCNPGLYRSLDWGKTFTQVDQFKYNSGNKISISPEGVYFYITYNIYYRSFDGLFWERMNMIDNEYSPTIFVNPNRAGQLFVSKTQLPNVGLYRSNDNGSNWALMNSSVPFRNGVNQMTFSKSGKICMSAGTSGIGCSTDEGATWSEFVSPNPTVPHEYQHFYVLTQNPDDDENLLVLAGSWSGQNEIIYSYEKGQTLPKTVTVPQMSSGLAISQGVTYVSGPNSGWLKGIWRNDGVVAQPEYLKKHPIIIVPGILGSWRVTNNSEFVLDPIFGTYDGLVKSLEENGYEKDKMLFPFPYNWRQDNVVSGIQLKQKIAEAKAKSGIGKVDIVAHSMGGLVARSYVESDDYNNDVNKIIFLGTPHLGSPEAYPAWEGGEIGFNRDPLFANILKFVFQEEAENNGYNTNELQLYIKEKVPSVGQLLPIFDYLGWFGNPNRFSYPTFYPRNQFLEDLDKNKGNIAEKNIGVINIVTDNLNTPSGFGVLSYLENLTHWLDGIPSGFYGNKEGIYYGKGDKTVPIESATGISGEKLIVSGIAHKDLPDNTIDKILDKLQIQSSVPVVNSLISEHYLIIKAYSPVNFLVISPTGKRVGLCEQAGALNEITGAYYSGADNAAEFVTIPNPELGQYRVVTSGTAVGSYKIESTYIDEEKSIEKTSSYEGNTSVGSLQTIDTTLEDLSGNMEVKVEDNMAPVTNIGITGGEKEFYNYNPTLTLSASDEISGVKKTEYNLDGVIWQEYLAPVVITSSGLNNFSYRSIDSAGNTEETHNKSIYIDKISPLVLAKVDKGTYTHWDKLLFSCAVIDSGSGVDSSIFKLGDTSITCINQVIDLTNFSLGNHSISWIVTDKAGNTTIGRLDFIMSVTFKSTLLDMEWLYKNKYLGKAQYSNYVIRLEVARLMDILKLKDQRNIILNQLILELDKDKRLKVVTEVGYNQIRSDLNWLIK